MQDFSLYVPICLALGSPKINFLNSIFHKFSRVFDPLDVISHLKKWSVCHLVCKAKINPKISQNVIYDVLNNNTKYFFKCPGKTITLGGHRSKGGGVGGMYDRGQRFDGYFYKLLYSIFF